MKAVGYLAAVAVICLSALTGCGSDGDPTTDSTSAAPSPNPTSGSDDMPTRTEAVAFAKAVNLRVKDIPLPGFEAEGVEEESPEGPFSDCLGLDLNEIANPESPTFGRSGGEQIVEQFSSAVGVFASPAEALTEMEEVKTKEGERCLIEVVESLDQEGLHFGEVTIDELHGGDDRGAIALRLETSLVTEEGESVPMYLDLRGMAVHQSTVALFAVRSGEPADEAGSEELLAVLQGRAEEFSLGGGNKTPGG